MSAAYPFTLPLERTASAASRPAKPKQASICRIWARRFITRRDLVALHREQLRDVGLDPRVVRAEALKPFWRA